MRVVRAKKIRDHEKRTHGWIASAYPRGKTFPERGMTTEEGRDLGERILDKVLKMERWFDLMASIDRGTMTKNKRIRTHNLEFIFISFLHNNRSIFTQKIEHKQRGSREESDLVLSIEKV